MLCVFSTLFFSTQKTEFNERYVCARTDMKHRLEINFSKDLVSFGDANLSRNRKAEVISGAT